MQEHGYVLWEAVSRSPSRLARTIGGNHTTVTVSQLRSGRYLLEYGNSASEDEMVRVVPLMNQNEVEEELRDLDIPVSPSEQIWRPLQEESGLRKDEDYYAWSMKAEEDDARRE